jgi:para-nitrobenzyl esterase
MAMLVGDRLRGLRGALAAILGVCLPGGLLMFATAMARGLFHKAIVESGGSRDSVLTARPMRADGVDPNYPVSAETIGINFARSMGIEGTDQDALAKLRALSAEEVLRGAPAQPGSAVASYETTPVLDGKLITETAETAYKAKHQPRIPLMVGSNSADTAGNRIRATTKEQLFARFGQWSAQAKTAYDPDGSTDLATLVSRANDDFGQAEPARFAANAFAANGSPVYLYRFSYVQTAMRERMRTGLRMAAKSPSCSAPWVPEASARQSQRQPRMRRSPG